MAMYAVLVVLLLSGSLHRTTHGTLTKGGDGRRWEWDGKTVTGNFSLVNDTTTTATIRVSGTLEIFGVVPAGSETRPAIDGGQTERSDGHTVFKVEGDETILELSNITIRNGYVSIF